MTRGIGGLLLALFLSAAIPAAAGAADPAPTPSRPATCAERYPADGPAGVDLRLGCIVSELVGLYSAGQAEAPPTLSAYAIGLIAGIALLLGAALVLLRILGRRAAARLAPVVPGEWWLCPSCRSVNPAQGTRCYRCGSPPGEGPSMPTAERPSTPQSFGRGKHR